MELQNKIVLITGVGRGLGRAFADTLLDAGATCVLTVRSTDDAARLTADFAPAGDRVVVERCDIARSTEVDALAQRARDRFGRVDVLVNNAGVFLDADHASTADVLDASVLEETLRTNLFGTIAMCRAFVPLIPRGGRIINLSSRMGQLTGDIDPHATAYSVSKTALNAYTSSLASALRARDVRADVMHPGWVKTDMGGPNAPSGPEGACRTLLFLATRTDGPTGRFWYESQEIAW